MEEQHPKEDRISALAVSEGVFDEAYIPICSSWVEAYVRDWNRRGWVSEGKRGREEKGDVQLVVILYFVLASKAPTLVGIELFFIATAQSTPTRRRYIEGGYSWNAPIRLVLPQSMTDVFGNLE